MASRVTMTEEGHLVVPATLLAEVGFPSGGDFLARVENGVIILEPHQKALERVRNLVRRYAPVEAGASVVDELITERHAAAAQE